MRLMILLIALVPFIADANDVFTKEELKRCVESKIVLERSNPRLKAIEKRQSEILEAIRQNNAIAKDESNSRDTRLKALRDSDPLDVEFDELHAEYERIKAETDPAIDHLKNGGCLDPAKSFRMDDLAEICAEAADKTYCSAVQ